MHSTYLYLQRHYFLIVVLWVLCVIHQIFRCKVFCNTDTVSSLEIFISHGHLLLNFVFRLEVIQVVVKKYWNQIHILDKLNHTQMIGTNIMMCYCTFLHFTAYSIAVWAVLKQLCSCHISVCWCLRGQQNCMCALNVARSQSYSNWAESICRFHCKLSEHTFMDDYVFRRGWY